MAALSAALSAGCDAESFVAGPAGPDAGARPNVSAEPQPLATQDARARVAPTDAGVERRGLQLGDGGYVLADAAPPPPKPIGPDEVLPAEQLMGREIGGVVLEAVWRWREVPPPASVPELSKSALESARRAAELVWRVEIADTGRLRAVFDSVALPLPQHAELGARADRYGTVVLWPNRVQFRVVAPGALRPALGERRVDVTPLGPGEVVEKGQGRRLDLATRRFELRSTLGRVLLETAKLPEAGAGAELLCRLLAEIAAVHPSTPACVSHEVVLSADYSWKEGGGVAFEVTSVTKRADLRAEDFLVPPPGARFAASGLPASPEGIFFTRAELAVLRTAAVEPRAARDPRAPGEGLVARNQSDRLVYLLLDGVPLVAPPPWSERYVIGPPSGRYTVQWRTFLGDVIEPAREIELPARITYGAGDAGAERPPDAG